MTNEFEICVGAPAASDLREVVEPCGCGHDRTVHGARVWDRSCRVCRCTLYSSSIVEEELKN